MATDAQITANRENAQSSTGPVTDQGKARCALNAQTFGLFSKHDAIGNDEVDEYLKFCAEYHADLVPLGAIEHTLTAEIIHAAWRLRRCVLTERMLFRDDDSCSLDELEDIDKLDRSLERARASAHRIFHRSKTELSRVQTERLMRAKLPVDAYNVSALGVASCKQIENFLKPGSGPITKQTQSADDVTLVAAEHAPITKQTQSDAPPCESPVAKQTQSHPAPSLLIPRSAPCPCGSGNKYKRCCGKDAPAVLSQGHVTTVSAHSRERASALAA